MLINLNLVILFPNNFGDGSPSRCASQVLGFAFNQGHILQRDHIWRNCENSGKISNQQQYLSYTNIYILLTEFARAVLGKYRPEVLAVRTEPLRRGPYKKDQGLV